MKKIKYSILSLLFIMAFTTSCSDDDNSAIAVSTSDVNATVGLRGNAVAEGTQAVYTVSLDRSFESDATVRVEIEYDDTRVATHDATLMAGSTSTEGIIVCPSTGGVAVPLDPNFDSATLKVVGIVLDDPIVGEAYNIVSNELMVELHETAPEIDSDKFNILFDWSNPDNNDLDLYVFETTTNTVVSTSFTGSRFEPGEILANAPDGTYGVNAEVYTNSDSEISYKFYYRNTDGELVAITGSWSGVVAGAFLAPDPFVTITKSGDTFTINNN